MKEKQTNKTLNQKTPKTLVGGTYRTGKLLIPPFWHWCLRGTHIALTLPGEEAIDFILVLLILGEESAELRYTVSWVTAIMSKLYQMAL